MHLCEKFQHNNQCMAGLLMTYTFLRCIFYLGGGQFCRLEFSAMGKRFISNLERTEINHLRLQCGFQILDLLLNFETSASQRPNLGQSSHFLTHCEIRGGMDEVSKSKQSIIIAPRGCFVISIMFLKCDWVENRCQISHSLTPPPENLAH